MQAPRWVLIWRSQGKNKLAAAVVQLDGSVLIWHMTEWFSTACCLYGARLKSEHALYVVPACCPIAHHRRCPLFLPLPLLPKLPKTEERRGLRWWNKAPNT
jgi:hypothetical protein